MGLRRMPRRPPTDHRIGPPALSRPGSSRRRAASAGSTPGGTDPSITDHPIAAPHGRSRRGLADPQPYEVRPIVNAFRPYHVADLAPLTMNIAMTGVEVDDGLIP